MIEKIISEIDKLIESNEEEANACYPSAIARESAYYECKEIVQEVAKDGGWISLSSGQIPENCRVCWITWKIDGYAEEVYRASCHNGCWFNLDTQEEVNVSEIVAWKYCEKPAPYQKGE